MRSQPTGASTGEYGATETGSSNAARLNKQIGRRLKEHRINAGMTQTALGSWLGLSGATVSRYEGGVLDVPLHHLSALCGLYGIDPVELFLVRDLPLPRSEQTIDDRLWRIEQLLLVQIAGLETSLAEARRDERYEIVDQVFEAITTLPIVDIDQEVVADHFRQQIVR